MNEPGSQYNLQEAFRRQLASLARQWQHQGLPSHQVLGQAAADLQRYKEQTAIAGLWESPPLMITATIDDGLGQGIDIIRTWAAVAGMQVIHLGLLQPAARIIAACRQHRPALCGTTVLQLDSEPVLAAIAKGLPAATRFIAGGPVFKFDPELAQRCGIDAVIANLTHFVKFLLQDV